VAKEPTATRTRTRDYGDVVSRVQPCEGGAGGGYASAAGALLPGQAHAMDFTFEVGRLGAAMK